MKKAAAFLLLLPMAGPSFAKGGTLSTVVIRLPTTLTGNTTFFYDTFTEASNTTNIAAHTMDIGPGWTGTDSNSGKLQINGTNDNLEATDNTGFYKIDTNGSPTSANYCVERDFVVGSNAAADVSMYLRLDASSKNAYYVEVGGDASVTLIRWDAGVDNVLASSDISTIVGSFSNSTTYHDRLCANGSSIVYDINGKAGLSATDSTYSAAGIVRLQIHTTGFKTDNVKALVYP